MKSMEASSGGSFVKSCSDAMNLGLVGGGPRSVASVVGCSVFIVDEITRLSQGWLRGGGSWGGW